MDISKILPKRISSVIIVTGTPGTGKTTLAKRIAKERNYRYVDVNKVVKEHSLSEGYDRKRKTKIVDEKRLAKALEGLIIAFRKEKKGKKTEYRGLVIDSHLSHYINPKYVDLCIVTKCSLKELEKRLRKKKYNKAKVEENIQSEIFDICYNEAVERGHRVKVVETG